METFDESWWTRVLAGPGGELDARDSAERYLVLPTAKNPRVVVDRSSRLAVRDAVARFAASRSTNTTVRQIAVRTAPVLAKTKGAWTVASSDGGQTLRDHVSEVLGESVRLSVAVGPPRPNRKPVIRCYGDRGLMAVAKLGPDPHTFAMVQNEAQWLDLLAQQPLDGVRTPQLLHAGEFGDSALLVMGAMDLESDLGLVIDEVPIAVTQQFSDRYTSRGSLTDSSWWSGLGERLGSSESLRGAMAEVGEHGLMAQVSVSAWHGDWSPWNMGRSTSGELYVWDWERATVGVPRGFDLLHLHYQYGSGLDAAGTELETLGVPRQQHDLLKRLYLLELCARHVEAASLGTDRHSKVLLDLERLRHRAGAQ